MAVTMTIDISDTRPLSGSLKSLTGGTGFNIPQYQIGTSYVSNSASNNRRNGNNTTINFTGNTISNVEVNP